ncbi:MAG: hypothetical protein RL316_454 [Bacteroidota bacterium]|jgi:hypothetical protein
MGLIIPASGDSDYPASISSSLTSVDSHNHTSGSGVQIPSAGIEDNAVTTNKINNLAVTTGKIANNAVTRQKLGSVGQQVSSNLSQSFTSTSYADVTSSTISITSTGRPIVICLIPSESSLGSFLKTSGLGTLYIKIVRDATDIAELLFDLSVAPAAGTPEITYTPSFLTIDPISAGSYSYKLQAKIGGSTTGIIANVKLMAYEL